MQATTRSRNSTRSDAAASGRAKRTARLRAKVWSRTKRRFAVRDIDGALVAFRETAAGVQIVSQDSEPMLDPAQFLAVVRRLASWLPRAAKLRLISALQRGVTTRRPSPSRS